MRCTVLVALVLVPLCYAVGGPAVTTKYGCLEGLEIQTRNNVSIDLFLGIPFAKPLTLRDRGRRPQPPRRWKGKRSAKTSAPSCYQIRRIAVTERVQYSEDCLYLNVYTPTNRNSSLLPVMVYIHGGGFSVGNAVPEPSQPFANYFAEKGIVVVVIQYRLASQGFAALNSSSFPGNIGLWDQTAALNYVSENIRSFGGDKDRVTVMGQSAGAMCIGALSVSPFSRDLFSQAVQLSGTSWMLSTYIDLVSTTELFFERLGCTNERRRLKCYQRATIDQILDAQIGLPASFTPIIGDDFLPIAPQDADCLPVKPLLTGLMSLESLLFNYLPYDPVVLAATNRTSVEAFMNTTVTPFYGDNKDEAFLELSAHFLNNSDGQNASHFIHQIAKMRSNYEFDVATVREVTAKSKKADVFLYNFDYFNEAAFFDGAPVLESYHAQEFPYIFDTYPVGKRFDLNAADLQVQQVYIDAIASFIIRGNPSTPAVPWPAVGNQTTHVKIRPQPIVATDLFKEDFEFWEGMKDLGYDRIFATPT